MVSQRGSHVKFRHPDGRSVVIPNHPARDLLPGFLRRVLGAGGVDLEEFERFL